MTQLKTAPAAREIEITRIIDAPRERLWKAWTEPEQLTLWWGKRGWTAPLSTITMDVRTGGGFQLTNVRDDGREMPQAGTYSEVREPERLAWSEDPTTGCPDTYGSTAEVTFNDLGDGRTEMRFVATLQTTAANLDNSAVGMSSAFDRLAEHLDR